jgi:multidrug efflux system membrane fusion protein
MRVALSVTLLLALSGAAAIWFGAMPLDIHALRQATSAWTAPPPVAAPAAPVAVRVAAARTGDVPIYLSGIGTVQAYNTVMLKSRVDGTITQILFTEGQDVHAGDPLIIIDPRPFQSLLAQAQAMRVKDQATLDGALLDLSRYANLVLKDFASRQQLDQQRATVEATRAQIVNDEAQIAYAQTQLGYTTIRSPIEGRVGIRQVDGGNVVHASDTGALVSITQLRPISVVFTLPAGAVALAHLTPGKVSVPVTAYAADDATLLDRGTVELVDNTVDPSTGTIKLKASFPNTDIHLWPGTFVNGKLVIETRHDAVTVPTPALRHGPRGDFVWIVRADSTVVSRGVVAGQADGGRVLIERGLERGTKVVTQGHFRLDENTKVEVTQEETPRRSGPQTSPQASPRAAAPG